MKLATVKIYDTSKKRLEKLAENHGKSELNYLSTSIDFIYKMGVNIYSSEVENVPDLIRKLEDRIIGFMKKREMDFFVPMSRKTQELVDTQKTFIDHLHAFDIIKFAEQQQTKEKEVPKFSISEDDDFNFASTFAEKNIDSTNVETTESEVSILDNSEAELLKGKLEKANKQMERYRDELQFLMDKVTKGTGLNTGKYMLNISQRDIERINRLLGE